MAAVLRDSVLYGRNYTSKFLGDPRTSRGRLIGLPFEATYASPSTLGDSYNLCLLLAGDRVCDLVCTTPTNAASVTWSIGDAGSATRFMAATAFTTANTLGSLAATGAGFTPIADTPVIGTNGGAAGTVGVKVVGMMTVVPYAN